MKKIICLVVLTAIVMCCFAGCENSEGTQESIHGLIEEGQPIDTDSTTTDTAGGIVTNYSECWITRTDGKVVRGTVISWMIVNENLIQVTMTNIKVIGDSGSSVKKVRTYLVSVDRVYFYTEYTD